jgi:hypothetical protein
MKDMLDIHTSHDAGVLSDIARTADGAANWAQGPDAQAFHRLLDLTNLLVLEIAFQTLLRAAITAGNAAAVAGKREEAEDILAAIAIEAAARAQTAARWNTLTENAL